MSVKPFKTTLVKERHLVCRFLRFSNTVSNSRFMRIYDVMLITFRCMFLALVFVFFQHSGSRVTTISGRCLAASCGQSVTQEGTNSAESYRPPVTWYDRSHQSLRLADPWRMSPPIGLPVFSLEHMLYAYLRYELLIRLKLQYIPADNLSDCNLLLIHRDFSGYLEVKECIYVYQIILDERKTE